MFFLMLFALIACITGCASLYVSWRRNTTAAGLIGWALVTASVWLWVSVVGLEYGLVYGLSLPALFVWIFIARERKKQGTRVIPDKPFAQWRWQGKKALAGAWDLVFLFLVLMLSSCLMTVAFVHYLPVKEADQMAIGIVLVPLIWGGLAVWYGMAQQKRVPLISTLCGAGFSGILLFV